MMNFPIAFPGFPDTPFRMFRIPEGHKLKIPRAGTEDRVENGEKKEAAIRCRNCGFRICGPEQRTDMDGRHIHVFNNPAGFVYEIGCFASAAGCVNRGEPTLEFTWFPGFSWQFALCSNCFTHLGWRYRSGSGRIFYGLILANIVEDTR